MAETEGGSATVTTSSTEILPNDPLRRRAVIRNAGDQSVFINGSGHAAAVTDFELPQGDSIEIRSQAQVNGIVAADSEPVDFWVETEGASLF